jgi:alkanesulfonate monooxygenase SsuD/methylene tetrahydromethanopterin reductase-like flavin-dependent oxidoreductase (luciferase family)
MRYGIFDQIEIDGRPLADLYRDRLALVRAADEAGFERYHKSEHHMIGLDAIPQMGLFFAAAAQHTGRIRFASLVYLLPFHHPIRLAEEICSLDHLLGGRFDVGVGRGISPPEHELWGLEPDQARENFDETLAVLRQALTTHSLTFHGSTYHFDELPIVLSPYQ